MQNQSALIWIVILLLTLIIVLLSICLYFDIKPILETFSPITTDADTSTAPPSTSAPDSSSDAITTAPPVTTTPPVTSTTKVPTTTDTPTTYPTPDPDAPTICIDPGHGFGDPGTLGKLNGTTYFESDINLEIALKLKDALLARGYNVVMTHDGVTLPPDKYLSTASPIYNVNNRCDWIVDRKSSIDLVISVHCNAYTADTSVKGSRYYILPYGYTGYTKYSQYLANSIVATVKTALSLSKLPTVYTQKLAVLQSALPSVLLECGFMTNASDLQSLINPTWQTKYANGVAEGIVDYCEKYIK